MSDKRSQLIEASIDLFSKEGFWNTSTARISRHAGVATGTLFNYFPSKEALIDEVYVLLKRELMQALASSSPDPDNLEGFFSKVYSAYIRWGVANPQRFMLLEQLRLSDLVSESAQQQVWADYAFIADVIDEASRPGQFADIPQDYLLRLITAHIETSVRYAVDLKLAGKDLDEFCSKGARVLWKGITP